MCLGVFVNKFDCKFTGRISRFPSRTSCAPSVAEYLMIIVQVRA